MNDRQSEHPDRSVLVAFGLGKLPPAEVAAVESHIADCPECCETLQSFDGDTFVDLVCRADGLEFDPVTAADEAVDKTAAFPGESDELTAHLPPELANHPRYRILRQLGRGGMGVVFAAEHRLMNRLVALKVIRPNLIKRPDAVARFRREVQAAAKLAHPNIVTAFDAEQAGELHFLVMEYVEGTQLSQIVERDGPLPVAMACNYVRQMADALQHAHQSAMVHRDIKPHNVMVEPNGQVKILDFGIATLVETKQVAAGDRVGNIDSTDIDGAEGTDLRVPPGNPPSTAGRLTEMGTVMGTPDFVAPEQVANPSSADIRADIYSLGCTLYYLLAGQPPFPDGTAHDKLRAHSEQTPRSLTTLNRVIPPELDEVVKRMMAKDVADRYQEPSEVAAALRPFAPTPPTHMDENGSAFRRFIFIALATAALLCSVAAAVIFVKMDQGTLEIHTSEQEVQLVLSQDGRQVKVIDVRSGSSIERLRSGQYNVDLRGGDDLKLTMLSKSGGGANVGGRYEVLDGFTLSRGEHLLVSVERKTHTQVATVPGPQAPPAPTDRPAGDAPHNNSQSIVANPIDVLLLGVDDAEIRGVVDVERDKFIISSWTNADGKTWTPRASQMPLELVAVTKNGRPYDVPVEWEGNMQGFAFQLPADQDIAGINWNEDRPSDFMRGASFGWGGLRNSLGGIVLTDTHRFDYVPSDIDTFTDINLARITVERTSSSGQRIRNVIVPPRSGGRESRPVEDGQSRISLFVQPTDVIPIAVHNPGFEEQSLPDGEFAADKIPHWTVEAVRSGAVGVQNLRNEDFAGAADGGDATTLPEGRNVAYSSGAASSTGAVISQVLPIRLEPDTHYTVHVCVGRRATGGWPGYQVQLRASGELLAADDNSLTPAPGQFVTSIVNFVSGANDAQLDQPLEIRLLAGGADDQSGEAQVQFDRVQVYSQLTTQSLGKPSISLFWVEAAGSRGYVVERSEAGRTGPFTQIVTVEGDLTTYVDDDPSLRSDSTYYYRVLRRGSNSVRSAPLGVTTLTKQKAVRN